MLFRSIMNIAIQKNNAVKIVATAITLESIREFELWCNEISLAQLSEMKKIFVEEKLYYDFLR